ncbi:hypothetical protein EDD85DRAFT_958626 [Armillaria nabsnona]|nr:hypothetical protein EDD85DRAFT_958626 [Armillaria nabsnona]
MLRFGYYKYLSPNNWAIVAYARYFKASPSTLVHYQLVDYSINLMNEAALLASSFLSLNEPRGLTTPSAFLINDLALPLASSAFYWVKDSLEGSVMLSTRKKFAGYITLLSKTTNELVLGNYTGIEPEALQSHIEDLHQVSVILAICMSIALNGNTLLDIVDWHIDDNHFLESYYADSRKDKPLGDANRLKRNLKGVVDILTYCVGTAKDRNSSINLPFRIIGNPRRISMAKVEENGTRLKEARNGHHEKDIEQG